MFLNVSFMKRSYLIFAFCLFCTLACKQKDHPEESIPKEKVDFFSYKIVDTGIPDSLIVNKRYIKIDGSNEKLLFGTIENVKIIDGRIYILDWDLRSLTVYDEEGRGIGKVGEPGKGPGEYLQITDFDADESGNVYIWDGEGDQLYLYDRNFQFIRSFQPTFDVDLVRCLPGKKLMFVLSTWNEKEYAGTKVLVTDLELNMLGKYLQYDEYVDNAYLISGNTLIESEGHFIFNQENYNHVYLFSADGKPEKDYVFDFGSRNVPDSDKKDVMNNLKKYDSYCVLKGFTAITDKYMLGTLWYGRETRPFLINRKDGEIYLGPVIEDDDLGVLTHYSGKTVITYLSPEEEPEQMEDFRKTGVPEDVTAHLKNGGYVLCLYELK